jgi:hypothetical protein
LRLYKVPAETFCGVISTLKLYQSLNIGLIYSCILAVDIEGAFPPAPISLVKDSIALQDAMDKVDNDRIVTSSESLFM